MAIDTPVQAVGRRKESVARVRLSAGQGDPLLRARTRMRCLFLRVWAGGWNPQDVDACGQALGRAAGFRA